MCRKDCHDAGVSNCGDAQMLRMMLHRMSTSRLVANHGKVWWPILGS